MTPPSPGRAANWKAGARRWARCILRRLLVAAVTLAALLVAAYFIIDGITARHEEALLREWAATGETLDEFLARFPPRPDNASALELEALAARCGISLVPKDSARSCPPLLSSLTARTTRRLLSRTMPMELGG